MAATNGIAAAIRDFPTTQSPDDAAAFIARLRALPPTPAAGLAEAELRILRFLDGQPAAGALLRDIAAGPEGLAGRDAALRELARRGLIFLEADQAVLSIEGMIVASRLGGEAR